MMLKNLYMFVILITLGFNVATAQVGINTQNPEPSAALDVTATDKGFLIPQYSLTSLSNTISPVANPAEGSMIYNTGGTFPKGNYYWTGAQWERLFVNSEYDQILKIEKKGANVEAIPAGVTTNNIISFDATGIINTIPNLSFAGGNTINLPAGTYKIDVSFDCSSPNAVNSSSFIANNHLYVINAAIVDNSGTAIPLTDVKVSSVVAGSQPLGSIQGYRFSFILTLLATTPVRLRLNHNQGASDSSRTNVNNAGIVASFYKFL